jgi:predicted ATPase with chaperone activity
MSEYLKKILTPEQIDELQAVGMIEIKKFFEKQQREQQPGCHCRDCENEKAAIEAQFNHPFYDRVDEFRDEIKAETMIKAAKKYKEPFNPGSWSIRQLGKHAMAENYDQGNYIVGLVEKAEELEQLLAQANARIQELEGEVANTKSEAEFWRLRLIKEVGDEKGAIVDVRI